MTHAIMTHNSLAVMLSLGLRLPLSRLGLPLSLLSLRGTSFVFLRFLWNITTTQIDNVIEWSLQMLADQDRPKALKIYGRACDRLKILQNAFVRGLSKSYDDLKQYFTVPE